MDFKHKSSPPHHQNGNQAYMEHHHQQHRSPYNELSTNQSLLHHINTKHEQQQQQQYHNHAMDVYDYQQQQKHHQNTMFVKNHYHSPKARHLRRRARSECLSPSRSPQHYPQYPKQQPKEDLWRMHRDTYTEQPNMHRFHNLQIDGKGVQYEDYDDYNYASWHQQRRFRASSESASHDYYFREAQPEDVRTKRTREATNSPAKERRSLPPRAHHVTNPKNNFSVLVNNTTHYRYSPKSKVRSHYVGHKVGVVRVSSPLHKARIQMWKSQSSSASNSVPSTETPPQNDDDEDSDSDSDDDDEPPIIYGPGEQVIDDDMTDPEDNYESSLSISSSERSIAQPAPTINTDCVQGGRVLSAPFAASLFPFVPPYITFATFEEKGPEIPAIIHKQLKWKLTTITPLLVRKVLLNTGFRLMKSE
jgi:hypothetical protein